MNSSSADYSTKAQSAQEPGKGFLNPPWKTASRIRFGRIQVFAAIVALHALIIYALQHGTLKQVIHNAPAAALITLILPQSTPLPAIPPTVHLSRPESAAVPVLAPKTASPISETSPPTPVSAPAEETIVTAPANTPPVLLQAEPKLITSGLDYLRLPQPTYPIASRRLKEQGKTLVRVLVSAQGNPEKVDIQQSSGSARLDDAALKAVMHALFKPYMEDGQPVAVYAVVPIQFHLDS